MKKFAVPRLVVCVMVFIGLSIRSASATDAESRVYTVFVVPQLTPVSIFQAWTPVLEKVQAMTGVSFALQIPQDIPAFEAALAQGLPDFAFMNPYHMLLANRLQAYIPLLRDAESLLQGMLVVKKQSPIRSISDLNGKKIAFPAPHAFAACLYIRSILAKQHIEIQPVYVHNHRNVYRSVLLGDMPAGGGIFSTLALEPEDVREQLQVLFVTPKTAPHPLAAHPRVPEAVRTKLVAAWMQLAADPANAQLFAAIQMTKPVLASFAKDYLPLQKLRLEKVAEPEN